MSPPGKRHSVLWLWGCESESRRPAEPSPDLHRRDRLRWAETGADWLRWRRQAQLGSEFLQGRIRIRHGTAKEATFFWCDLAVNGLVVSFSPRYFRTWTQFPHTLVF